MFVVFKKNNLWDTLTSNDIPYGVMSGFIFSTDQSAKSLSNL